LIDVMATAVELAGAKYPAERGGAQILPMEGVSLGPALAGKPLDRQRPLFWEHEGNKAIRDGRWKLVQKWLDPWELYDIEADRTERRNLISEQGELAARLETQWNAWAERTFVDPWPGPDHTNWGQDITAPPARTAN
jgi:arylsulfatase